MKRLSSEKIKEDKNIVAFITSEYEQDVNSFNEILFMCSFVQRNYALKAEREL